MSAVLAWFLGTKVGRWLVGVAAIIAAGIATYWIAHRKGAVAQKAADDAAQRQSFADAAQAAVETYNAAGRAAQQVQQAAAQRPAPDPVAHDDFDNTGLGS